VPIDYDYDAKKRILRTSVHGAVCVNEIVNYLERVLKDPRVTYGTIEVFSMEHATDLQMNFSQTQVFEDLWGRYKKKVGQNVIIYAPNDLAYGLFRMLVSSIAMSDESAESGFTLVQTKQELEQILVRLGAADGA